MFGPQTQDHKARTSSLVSRIEEAVGFVITRAVAGDAAQLAALHRDVLPPGWPASDLAAFCEGGNRLVLKAGDGVASLGFAVLQFAAGEGEILTLAVKERARRQGVASALMNSVIGACKSHLISCIYLEVAEGNTPGRELYGKFGFDVLARRNNYYRYPGLASETALIMRLFVGGTGSPVDPERSNS